MRIPYVKDLCSVLINMKHFFSFFTFLFYFNKKLLLCPAEQDLKVKMNCHLFNRSRYLSTLHLCRISSLAILFFYLICFVRCVNKNIKRLICKTLRLIAKNHYN